MKDKICLVTGVNYGIGKATADGLLEKGANESKSSNESYDEYIAKQLWEKSAALCGLDSGK
ncbi:MAG: hypothetical protein ACE5IW_06820 [bacterium]